MTVKINDNGYTFPDGSHAPSSPNAVKKIISHCTYDIWAVQTYADDIYVAKGNAAHHPEAGTGFSTYHGPTKLNFGADSISGSKIKSAKVHAGAGAVLFENGNLWMWGQNETGVVGVSGTASVPYLTLTGVNRVWIAKNFGWDTGKAATFVEKTDGTIWATGHNIYGRLGVGDNTNKFAWTQVTSLGTNQVRELWNLGSIYGCTFVQKNDNTILAAGYNGYGQLGNGNTTDQNTFVDVTTNWGGAEQITDVSGGYGYYSTSNASMSWTAMIVKSTKTVYTAGRNDYGQIGNGTTGATNYSTPVNTGVTGVTSILCTSGIGTATALKSDGTLWAWGYNGYGQLGRGSTTSSGTPTQCTGMTNVAEILTKEWAGNTWDWYNNVFVRKNDGTVWCVGYNASSGMMGVSTQTQYYSTYVQNPYLTGCTQLAVGGYGDPGYFLSAIDGKGKFVQWGYSRYLLDAYLGLNYYTTPMRRYCSYT